MAVQCLYKGLHSNSTINGCALRAILILYVHYLPVVYAPPPLQHPPVGSDWGLINICSCHGNFCNGKHKIKQLSSGKFILYICRWAKCTTSYDVTTQSNEHMRNSDFYNTSPSVRGEGGRSSHTLWCHGPRPVVCHLSRSAICEHPPFLFTQQRVLFSSAHNQWLTPDQTIWLSADTQQYPYVSRQSGRGKSYNFMTPWPIVTHS